VPGPAASAAGRGFNIEEGALGTAITEMTAEYYVGKAAREDQRSAGYCRRRYRPAVSTAVVVIRSTTTGEG
jgi:hypothetical protein